MNRKKFYENITKIEDYVIGVLCDELEKVADDIDELENNEIISSVEYKIPTFIYDTFNNRMGKVYELLKWCETECKNDKTDDADLIEYIDNIREVLNKFKNEYCDEGIDDSGEIYDLISDLQLPFEDLHTIFKDDWKVEE